MKFVSFHNLEQFYDVVIVGCGPSGLAAAMSISCSQNGTSVKCIAIDTGKKFEERNRNTPEEMTSGVGGSGLFSDGKFSFFPSGTNLWNLSNKQVLEESYQNTSKCLTRQGMNVPPFPSLNKIQQGDNMEDVAEEMWHLKRYPSMYLDLEQRKQLTQYMQDMCNVDCCLQLDLLTIRYTSEDTLCKQKLFVLQLQHVESMELKTIVARKVIFCTGRFGPLLANNLQYSKSSCITNESDYSSIDTKFSRLEIGFRIEENTEESFFVKSNTGQTDPKFTLYSQDGEVEWRTFCACKNGETVFSNTRGLWTVSGRADCSPTGRSNIGLNTRILNEQVAKEAWKTIKKALQSQACYFRISLAALLVDDQIACSQLDNAVGSTVRQLMQTGLHYLAQKFPTLSNSKAMLIGPTLEGILWYPKVDNNLKVKNLPCWVAGDASGKFRGIVASMISGYYAGKVALEGKRAIT